MTATPMDRAPAEPCEAAGALFDLPGDAVRPGAPEQPKLSPDRRRTIRQRDALAAGRHPIGLLLGIPIKLHADAAPSDDRTAAGLRCKTCKFRTVNPWGYGKCTRSDATTSHSAASDNRAWWPACVHFEPADGES